jgi:DNA-binding transcriptional MocR family regulator
MLVNLQAGANALATMDGVKEEMKRAEAELPAGVTWRVPHHGLHLWLQIPPSVDADRFHDEAQRRGVVVNPGAFHSPNNTRRDGVRLTYCSEPSDRLVLAGRRLGQAAHAALGTAAGAMTTQDIT